MRLINYIRKQVGLPFLTSSVFRIHHQAPSSAALTSLSGTEAFLSDDANLRPVVEDEPLLRPYLFPGRIITHST